LLQMRYVKNFGGQYSERNRERILVGLMARYLSALKAGIDLKISISQIIRDCTLETLSLSSKTYQFFLSFVEPDSFYWRTFLSDKAISKGAEGP
ncbi:MAG: hypothetical protein K2X47_12160, partial [Bdellovibrionales bacterium]|nr:hypothetical protein [Bdellovibrionales bacterium]